MKRFPVYIISVVIALTALSACLKTDDDDKYKDWRLENEQWYNTQKLNTSYYTVVQPTWNTGVDILMHWYNDRSLTAGNLKPLYTSTVDVKYHGALYDGTAFDSSYLRTSPADSIFRLQVNSNVIEGWAVALTNMRVGDSCRVVIPYNLGYGSYSRGTVIKPYSMLVFDMKLQQIYTYETK